MDLNLVIYDDGFNLDKSITDLIECCHQFKYKQIALSVQITFTNKDCKIPVPPILKFETENKNIKISKRLTVKIEDSSNLFHMSKNENLKHYDLLAIEPMNEKILNYLNSGNFEFDILTFSTIDAAHVNMIKKANFSLPISKNIGIEINYSNCLTSSALRRQTIAFGQMLVDKTRSKNIILSSGTSIVNNIRSPRDVTYIGLLFGLQEHQCKNAVFKNPLKVIQHSELRQNINSSIVNIIENDNLIDHKHNNDGIIYDELCEIDDKFNDFGDDDLQQIKIGQFKNLKRLQPELSVQINNKRAKS